jgi:hypothetical protein
MNRLRIIDNLRILEEHDNAALSGKLVCQCGCENFSIFHTGKQTRGILFTDLVKRNGQIQIDAKCENCQSSFTILDTAVDGTNPRSAKKGELKQLYIKDIDSFEIRMYYNYYSENFKTNRFEDCIIEASNSALRKNKIIYE